MKTQQARDLIVLAWDEWAVSNRAGKSATGRETLAFFHQLQDVRSPLLHFGRRQMRDKWPLIHAWLVEAGRVSG